MHGENGFGRCRLYARGKGRRNGDCTGAKSSRRLMNVPAKPAVRVDFDTYGD